ncbi:ABC transporter permease [Streptosporangium sp. NPDC003464]
MPGYIKVEALRMLRNKRYVIFVVAFPVAFYLLSANLYGAGGVGAGAALMVSMSAYGALAASMMSTAVPWAQERRSGWLRQLQVTPLANRTIIVTKLVTALLLVLPSILLVCAAAVLTQGVSLPPGRWAALILVMWAGAVPFAALGLTIGSLLPPDTGQPVAVIGTFGLAALGGLWFQVDALPSTMRAVAHVMPSFSYADMGRSIIAGHGVPLSDALTVGAWAVGLGAVALAAYRRATVRG